MYVTNAFSQTLECILQVYGCTNSTCSAVWTVSKMEKLVFVLGLT